MPKLTSAQAFSLAQEFHDIAVELGNFRFNNWENLTTLQRRRLEDLQFDVLNDSSKLNALSISLAVNDLQGTIDNITNATTTMKNTIRTLQNINRAIKIATAAVTLGAAIISMNPTAIGTAIASAINA